MSPLRVNHGGHIKDVTLPHARHNGAWKACREVWAKHGGVWRMVWGPFDGPVLTRESPGVFRIDNFDPTLLYTVSSTTGDAHVAGGKLLLPSATSAANIDAQRYLGGEVKSNKAARAAHTYRSENHRYACGSHQCNCSSSWVSCGKACDGGGCGCYPGPTGESWGQCGVNGPMCWYNGQQTTCGSCTSYCDNWVSILNDVPGYTNSGGEWWKIG